MATFDRREFLKRVGLTSLVLATPYVLTSCSTLDDETLEPAGGDALAEQFGKLEPFIRASNPHIQYFNSSEWGYSTVEFTRAGREYTAYSVDKSQPQGAPSKVIRRLRVPSGQVRLQQMPLSSTGDGVLANEGAEVAI